MSRNTLKITACLSMLIDHIGFLLFPKIILLRCAGRIAMPIFAFFIAEGCRYTKSKSRYFLNVFLLALLCQAAYMAADLLNGAIKTIYLNILFTLAMSQILCSLFLIISCAYKEHDKSRLCVGIAEFIIAFTAFAVFCCFGDTFPIPTTVDYGFAGVILPLFAVIFSDRKKQLISFTCGLLILNLTLCDTIPYTWFSLLALPLIFSYSGKTGIYINKWVFYAFYPLHIVVLYAIRIAAF